MDNFDIGVFLATSQELRQHDLPEPASLAKASKRKGKRPLDAVEVDKRNYKRRENQKVACRNYRMRKKEHLSDLKARIEQLEAEREALLNENLAHKRSSPLPDNSACTTLTEMSRILSELGNALRNRADDNVIEFLLQAFFNAGHKFYASNEKDIDELVNPATQAKLATMGYIPSMDFPEIAVMHVEGWWESFVMAGALTHDQASKLHEVISQICKRDYELRVERGLLDKHVKQFYQKKLAINTPYSLKGHIPEPLDTNVVAEFTWLLSRLKTNICTQKSLLLNTQSDIAAILSPRQHALLVLNVCQNRMYQWPYHAQTLKAAWDLICRADDASASSPVPSPESPTSPPPSPSPYSSPTAATAYYSPTASPPTVIPSIAIPTPASPYPTQAFTIDATGFVTINNSTVYATPSSTIAPQSPTLSSTCTSHVPSGIANVVLNQSFLSPLHYGVH